jgi:hypothetical protein
MAACGVALALMTVTLSSVSESRQPVTSRQLLDQFQNTPVFWRQFEIAKQIVALHDPSVLPELVSHCLVRSAKQASATMAPTTVAMPTRIRPAKR